jgi:hypothetical protein
VICNKDEFESESMDLGVDLEERNGRGKGLGLARDSAARGFEFGDMLGGSVV